MTSAQVNGGTLVLPVGSMEQHGPHLPLSTDTDIAAALAERLGRAVREVVVATPIAYGSSGEHDGFPGTISIGQRALELVLVEFVRSASASFERVVLVSTHGGNAKPVARATGQLRAESRSVVAWSPQWSGDAHAGRSETSIMLALNPSCVDLPNAKAGNLTPIARLEPTLRRRGVQAVSPNGVLGDPAGASAEEGHALLDRATADLIAIVNSP